MRSSLLLRVLTPLALVLAAGVPMGAALGQYARPKAHAATGPAAEETVKAADQILADLASKGDAAAAKAAAAGLLRTLAEQDKPTGDLVLAARTLRLVVLVGDAGKAGATPAAKSGVKEASGEGAKESGGVARLVGMLKESPAVADALAWAYVPGKDRAGEVLKIVGELRDAGGPVEKYPELAAAIAVVHDMKDPRAQKWSPAPVELFEYYTDPRQRLLMPVEAMPGVLLVHLVDCVVSREEMGWAYGQYRSNARVGVHYKEVRYDTPFFKGQQPKKMDGQDYTLRNILKFGGVCVEQAYFAEMIGKAIGVPTATVTARGDSVGHAWIGYLMKQNRGWAWDLTEGRYDEYEGEQADVMDPQTGASITDAELQMKADRASMSPELVRESLARADAAAVMSEPQAALAMMERAVNACPYVPAAWERMAELAGKKKLAPADLEKWGMALVTLCGTKYPDFAVKVLDPLIKTMADPADRAACWAWARGELVDVQRNRSLLRHDLAVSLRVREGDCLREGKDEAGAWAVYQEAIKQYGKKTPAVQAAAGRCEKMLMEAQKSPAEVVDFWSWAWKQTDKPKKMSAEFAMGSNYSVFGMRYAAALERSGDPRRAEQVRRDILPKDK